MELEQEVGNPDIELPQEPEGQDEEVPVELVEQPGVSPTVLKAIMSQMETCANEIQARQEETSTFKIFRSS